MEIIIATNNPGKLAMFRQALAYYGFKCIGLTELGLSSVQVVENGATPEENALSKARAAWEPGRVVFADDAGLEIDALNGEPGVQTRRWNGLFPDTISDEEWLNYLLGRLKGVPLAKRTASFVSGWALITPDGIEHAVRINTPFVIAEEPVRPMTPGFPMSAVTMRWHENTQGDAERCVKLFSEWSAFREVAVTVNKSGGSVH